MNNHPAPADRTLTLDVRGLTIDQAHTLEGILASVAGQIRSAVPEALIDLDLDVCCVECKCTDDEACLGGCTWIHEDDQPALCSSCAPKGGEQ